MNTKTTLPLGIWKLQPTLFLAQWKIILTKYQEEKPMPNTLLHVQEQNALALMGCLLMTELR